MFLEIVVFNNEAYAKRYKDFHGKNAQLYDCDKGAEVVGRAGLGFTGYTDTHVWIVAVKHKSEDD